MAKASLTCPEWDARPVYWSTVAYVRAWWGSDGARVRQIKKNGGISPRMLRSLGHEYNVNRSIIRKDKKRGAIDQNAEDVVLILNKARSIWPANITDRADCCVGLAKAIKKYTRNESVELASAATKFMWFLEPGQWTVYDRFAAAGVRVPSSISSSIERMQEFYKILAREKFVELVSEMQPIVERSALRDLPATRIIDTLLMARGGRGGDEEAVERLKFFLDLLPEPTRKQIDELACNLQSHAPQHSLTIPDRPAIRRQRKAQA